MKLPENLPSLKGRSRETLLSLLLKNEYGCPPPRPDQVEFIVTGERKDAFAGKAFHRHVSARLTMGERRFAFLFQVVLPKSPRPVPGVVLINFTSAVPDPYLPSEELCDLGLAVASFCYADVSPDSDDFQSKAGGFLQVDRRRSDAPGKLAIWAWAASLVLDYLLTCPQIDPAKTAVAGHSRLGKTALLAGALDQRFQLVYSNESGCSGAALYRGKKGETAKAIWEQFPYWFCPAFQQCTGNPKNLPFDQHFLLALIAPRLLYVSSAAEDQWADPLAEFRGCQAATEAYLAMGLSGLTETGDEPRPGEAYHQGTIGYHLRMGTHFFSRDDWRLFAAYAARPWS